MINYRVKWLHPDEPGKWVTSVVAYDIASAQQRRDMLISQGRQGVTIIQCKPGSYEEI